MHEIWLGLFSGIAFGFVIQRVGATNANKMALAHLMVEPEIPQFMLLTVAVGAAGLLGLESAGVGRTMPLPLSLVATGLAAVIFGVGWGLSGYCPGTCWAAAGEGRMDAIFALLGGLAGTAVFAQLHEWIIPALYAPTNLGQITLEQWFGSKVTALIVLLAGLAGAIFAIGRLWRRNEPF
jgi:uncharacterized membrane protein YedE/YeeE